MFTGCLSGIWYESQSKTRIKWNFNHFHVLWSHRSEYDGDLQSQILSKANEEDKNCSRSLSVVSAVIRAAKDLLHRAFAVEGKTSEVMRYYDWGLLQHIWMFSKKCFALSVVVVCSRRYPRPPELLQSLLHASPPHSSLHRPGCCLCPQGKVFSLAP